MVKDVERVEVEAQPESFVQEKFLAQGHVEADLEWRPEYVAAGVAVERFIEVAPGGIAGRDAVLSRRHKLREEVVHVQNGFAGVHSCCALELGLLHGNARLQANNRISDIV